MDYKRSSLLSRAFGVEMAHYTNFRKHVDGYVTYSNVFRAQGVLKAAADDYAGGHLIGGLVKKCVNGN